LSLLPIFSEIAHKKNAAHISTVNPPNSVISPKINPSDATDNNAGNQATAVIPGKSSVVETAASQPGTRRVSVRGVFSTPSILDALKDESNPIGTGRLAEKDGNNYQTTKAEQSFSQSELMESWKDFVGRIDAPQLKSALSAREPLLTENWQVEYELDTELQLNRLTLDLKPKLLGHLRRMFKNDAIEILFKVSSDAGQQHNIPYTDGERWDSLVKQYPALSALKSKFGLDFEHF
jgi:hypothetical protein